MAPSATMPARQHHPAPTDYHQTPARHHRQRTPHRHHGDMTPDTPRVDGEQPLPGMPTPEDTGHPTPPTDTTGHPAPVTAPATTRRPRFTAAEAARRCGVGRTTIMRALEDGRITGADKTDNGWRIPVESLLAAGFTPTAPPTEKPSPTTPDRNHDRNHDRSAHLEDLAALRAEIAALTANLDHERIRREHAEQDAAHAQAIATDRAQHIDHLAHALRLIENKPPTNTPTQKTDPQPPTQATAPASRNRFRRWFTADH